MLTAREARVITLLSQAWSEYLKLPAKSTSDNVIFRSALESATQIILDKPTVAVTHVSKPTDYSKLTQQTATSQSATTKRKKS